MIDITGKEATDREAVATGRVHMSRPALDALAAGRLPKGDALATARVAGIMAAKRTTELIPFCHPIPISSVDLEFELLRGEGEVAIKATARTHAATGVEMEALTAVAVAALTIHDMCKGIDPGTEIRAVYLLRKSGGEAGLWERKDD
jgi:cyclic pyranopterin phosphate synthase